MGTGRKPPAPVRRDQPDSVRSDANQGEGDRASAARYNEAQQEFVASHDVEQAAQQAAPADAQQARELEQAEAAGRERAPAASREGDRAPVVARDGDRAAEAPREGDHAPEPARPSAAPGGQRTGGGARGDEQAPRRRGRFLRRRR